MRTWKWTLTASLLIAFQRDGTADDSTSVVRAGRDAAGAAEPGCLAEHSASRDRHARASGSDACRGRAHHHGPGG